ncbi:hypothetical protein [Deinococcus piscis]|nr:hypothetical protein [Deinococcus piscis]
MLTEAKAYIAGLRLGASLWTDGQGTFPCSDQRLADFVIVVPQVPPKTCQVRIEEGGRFTIAAEFQGGLALIGTEDEIRQVLPAELPKLSLK